MSYFRYADKQIYYEESGEGTPLILLHGNTSCGKMFDPILFWAAVGRTVLKNGLRTCGLTGAVRQRPYAIISD